MQLVTIQLPLNLLRNVLNLQPTPDFMSLAFHELSALLYRDNIWQKHAARNRLNIELTRNKMLEDHEEKTRLKALKTSLPPPQQMAELVIEHLLGVPWSHNENTKKNIQIISTI